MEYHTPGVYIREVDSGAKPIASVPTSVPGFIGLFPYKPPVDAIAITGSDGAKELAGKVVPQLMDEKGGVKGDAAAATTALTQAFQFKRSQIRDIKALFELHGAAKSGKGAPVFAPGKKGKVAITWEEQTLEVSETLVDVKGKVVSDSDQAVEDLLNAVFDTFALASRPAQPKTAADVLGVYGYEFKGARGAAMRSEYSVPPVAVTNKAEFFRWLQSFFSQYLIETVPTCRSSSATGCRCLRSSTSSRPSTASSTTAAARPTST